MKNQSRDARFGVHHKSFGQFHADFLRLQSEAKDLGHLGKIPKSAGVKDDVRRILRVKRAIGGQKMEVRVPVELVAVLLNEGNQRGRNALEDDVRNSLRRVNAYRSSVK